MYNFLQIWADYLTRTSLEILYLAIPAGLFSLLFRRKAPKFHYIVWTIVLLKTIIPSGIIQLYTPPVMTYEFPVVVAATVQQTLEPVIDYTNVIFISWIVVVAFLAFKFIVNVYSFKKVMQNNQPIDHQLANEIRLKYNIQKPVRIFQSAIKVPFTIGYRKPKIFIPENTDVKQLEFILAHEMAHIQRHDFLMIYVQNMITILFFFHPVVLLASGLMNYYRELVCDDMAIDAIQSTPKNYGRKIIEFLEQCLTQKRYPVLANGLVFSKKMVLKRIEYLINRKDNVMKNLSKIQILLISGLIIITGLMVACGSNKEMIKGDSKVKFVEFDKAPVPVGGFASIQKNVIYPQIAQEAGIEGQVVVQAFIDENGDVGECLVIKGVNKGGLHEAAIAAIKNTSFVPAQKEGKNLGVYISIPVLFKLQSPPPPPTN